MAKYDGEIVDGKGECPDCGGYYSIKASGEMRSHSCSGITVVEPGAQPAKTAKPARKRGSTAKTKDVPEPVAKLATALVAAFVEAVTQTVIARAIPIEREYVPENIYAMPEPDDMVKPFIALAWPQLPGKAQRIARDIADHSDVIDALFLWQEWLVSMRAFVKSARDYKRQQVQQGAPTNVVPLSPPPGATGTAAASGFTPFEPAGEPVG